MNEGAIEVSYRLTKAELREALRPSVRRFVFRFWIVVVILVVVVERMRRLLRLVRSEVRP